MLKIRGISIMNISNEISYEIHSFQRRLVSCCGRGVFLGNDGRSFRQSTKMRKKAALIVSKAFQLKEHPDTFIAMLYAA